MGRIYRALAEKETRATKEAASPVCFMNSAIWLLRQLTAEVKVDYFCDVLCPIFSFLKMILQKRNRVDSLYLIGLGSCRTPATRLTRENRFSRSPLS